MDNILLYLLKVSVGTMVLYLCYALFFSRDTFYLRNRIFLLALLVISLVAPLLNVSHFFPETSMETIRTFNSVIISGTSLEAPLSERLTSIVFSRLLIWLYFSISAIFLLRMASGIAQTFIIIRKGTLTNTRFPKVVLSEVEHSPFSFFPYVVIPRKLFEGAGQPEILEHERAHVRQGHTFDLLFSEMLIALLWFNPFIWLIKRAIVLNHEYLADNYSLQSSCSAKDYQYKLLNIPNRLMNVPLAHNFSSLIKNRIVMINKKPTQNYAALKNIIILPIAAILFLMFSFKPESDNTKPGKQKPQLSEASMGKIGMFLMQRVKYPLEAQNSSDTGRIYVVVKMGKGGVVKDCKAFTDNKTIKVPLLDEIVIIGYGPSAGTGIANSEKAKGNKHQALKTECILVVKKLSELNIPEWKDNDIEFAAVFNFILQ